MARVALYGRVSGHRQEEEETIRTQWHYLEAWARSEGHTIVGHYADENCQSWVPVSERPEGGRLLRDAARKKFDAVAIYKLGRWSRYMEVWHEGRRELRALGIDLLCINEDAKDDRPGDRFSLNVRLLVNEYERDNIASNCQDGRYARAAKGGYVGGFVPYGYRPADDPDGGKGARRLVPDEDGEAPQYRQFVSWLLDEKLSALRICQRLNALGVPTATQRRGPDRHRTTSPTAQPRWHPGRLCEILHNPVYCGRQRFGGDEHRDAIPYPVPPLIDTETWDAIQRRLDANRTHSRRNSRRSYLLSGLLYCEDCARTLLGWTDTRGRKEYRYYICPGRHPAPRGRGYCPLPWIRGQEIETDLWEKLSVVVLAHEATAADLRRQEAQARARDGGLQASRDGLRAARDRKTSALANAITLATEGLISREELVAQRRRLQDEIAAIDAEEERLARQQQDQEHQERRLAAAADHLAVWAEALQHPMSEEQRKALVQAFVDRIPLRITDDAVRATYELCFDQEQASPIEFPSFLPSDLNKGRLLLSLPGPTWERLAA